MPTPYLQNPNLIPEVKGVFIGYSPICKGFKVLNLSSSKIVLSRDVTFFESIFPFSESLNPPISENVFPAFPDPEHSVSKSQPSTESVLTPSPTSQSLPPVFPSLQPTPSVSSYESSLLPSQDCVPPCPSSPSLPVRVRKPPVWHNDYVMTASQSEPTSFKEACSNPLWKQAMEAELKALQLNQTWDRRWSSNTQKEAVQTVKLKKRLCKVKMIYDEENSYGCYIIVIVSVAT